LLYLPVWQHYEALGVFLLTHGMAGATAMILAPMQFSDRLRVRFTKSCTGWPGASM
jgi:hypothetical protein